MAFMPPFFSGSSAVPECVASSNSVAYLQQVAGFHSGLERGRVVPVPGGSARLLVNLHARVGEQSVWS